jgi:Domain of unknown function (DUF4177)
MTECPVGVVWEYKVFKQGPSTANLSERLLNEFGVEGWELVTFQPNGEQAYPGEGTYILKRQVFKGLQS